MATAASDKKIKVTTSDGATMETERDIAERSVLIKNLLEDLGGDNEEAIPIPNVGTTRLRGRANDLASTLA
jgi:S-phase kinase-associated protein 1